MSDCSTEAMVPKEPPKKCETCANFAREPFKTHAGACMMSYADAPMSGYLCVSDTWPCDRPGLYKPKADDRERFCKVDWSDSDWGVCECGGDVYEHDIYCSTCGCEVTNKPGDEGD